MKFKAHVSFLGQLWPKLLETNLPKLPSIPVARSIAWPVSRSISWSVTRSASITVSVLGATSVPFTRWRASSLRCRFSLATGVAIAATVVLVSFPVRSLGLHAILLLSYLEIILILRAFLLPWFWAAACTAIAFPVGTGIVLPFVRRFRARFGGSRVARVGSRFSRLASIVALGSWLLRTRTRSRLWRLGLAAPGLALLRARLWSSGLGVRSPGSWLGARPPGLWSWRSRSTCLWISARWLGSRFLRACRRWFRSGPWFLCRLVQRFRRGCAIVLLLPVGDAHQFRLQSWYRNCCFPADTWRICVKLKSICCLDNCRSTDLDNDHDSIYLRLSFHWHQRYCILRLRRVFSFDLNLGHILSVVFQWILAWRSRSGSPLATRTITISVSIPRSASFTSAR